MKILVLSDSHGRTSLMERVVRQYLDEVGAVCFLGDVLRDIIKLQDIFQGLPIYAVPGNCDFTLGSQIESVQCLNLGGVEILLTHGHLHDVKRNYNTIIDYATKMGVSACFFGHSHVAASFVKNGITFLNPGSITEPRGDLGKSYALVEIVNGQVKPTIIEVD